jgi:hypothetical protein
MSAVCTVATYLCSTQSAQSTRYDKEDPEPTGTRTQSAGDERDVLCSHVVQALYGARCLHLNSCVVRLEMVRHKGNTQPRVDRAEERRMSRIEPQCGQMRDMPLCVECVCAHTLKTFVGAEVGEEALQSKRRLLGVRRASCLSQCLWRVSCCTQCRTSAKKYTHEAAGHCQ